LESQKFKSFKKEVIGVRRTLTDITRQMIHATLWGGVIFFNIKIDIHVISMLYKEMEKIKNLIIKKTMYLLLQQ
jgi:hypothetical protein